jgi:hypothetical protein
MQQKNDTATKKPLSRLYRACHAELGPGDVKRVPRFGPLVGLFLRCPACGALGAHAAGDVGPVEAPDPPARPEQPSGLRLAGLGNPAKCHKCGRRISIVGDDLVATEE